MSNNKMTLKEIEAMFIENFFNKAYNTVSTAEFNPKSIGSNMGSLPMYMRARIIRNRDKAYIDGFKEGLRFRHM